MISEITVILGNQLFNPSYLGSMKQRPLFMCESDDLCTHFNYHQLKILFFFTAMREYRDELKREGFNCFYHECDINHTQLYVDVLLKFCKNNQVKTIHTFEIEDHFFQKKLTDFCTDQSIKHIIHESPLFLTPKKTFSDYLSATKRPFMKTFYEAQRKRLDILMDNGKPRGGKWSFDEENRKKTPKQITFPSIPPGTKSSHLPAVKKVVKQKFAHHIGETETIWFPITRKEVNKWLEQFIKQRFQLFGDYEDAIDNRSDFLFHSALSPLLNCGLLTPMEIINKIALVEDTIPIHCYEGFVRQIIGWREFIRGIYQHFDDKQQSSNFFNHQRKLTLHWYKGTTGVTPLDDAIKQVMRLGYTHHINRLMVIGNIMLLTNIDPKEVYRWFMECFIDSSDWVMGPNVYGMSQFSDGGIFATKPYFCGSNYIRKMSHYPKDDWCQTLDALYWRFILDKQTFLSKNFRLKMMVSKSQSFSEDRIKEIYALSDQFIERVSHL